MRGVLAVFLGISLIAAAPAQKESGETSAGDNTAAVSCLSQGYTEEHKDRLATLLESLDVLAAEESATSVEVDTIISEVVLSCADALDWGESTTETAFFYEVNRLNEVVWRSYGPLTKEELALVDTALSEGDRDPLWLAIEAIVQEGLTGAVSPTRVQDSARLDEFMMELGFEELQDKSYQAGALLGFVAMQRMAARDLAEGQ